MSAEAYAGWARARVARMLALGQSERVVVTLVASLDGVVTVEGRSAALSSDQDRALIGAWRAAADALLVGVPTLSAEVYGGGLFPPSVRAQRVAAGLTEMPPVVTIDRSGRLDVSVALRAREPLRLIAYVPNGAEAADTRVHWVRADDLSLEAVIRDLRTRFGHRLILAEPGPRLFRALREQRQVSDVSLTLAPIWADHGARLEPAAGADALHAVDVESVAGVTFVHLLTGDGPPPVAS